MKKFFYLITLLTISFASAQDLTGVINSHLDNSYQKIGLQAQDVNDVIVTSQSFSKSMDLYTVYVTQRYAGIEVFNSTSPFAVKNNEVVYTALSFEKNLAQKANTVTPAISATTAISNAASALGLPAPSNLTLLETVSPYKVIYTNGAISLENIPVQLVFQRLEDNTMRLAWDLSIYLTDASHYYSVRVDAVTGTLLDTNDWVVSCNFGDAAHAHNTSKEVAQSILEAPISNSSFNFMVDGSQYNVFPIPLESPNHGPAQIVSEPANVEASPFGWHDADGTAGAEFTITRGNNVYAQDDINANEGNDGFSPDGGTELNFNFPFNFNTAPVNMLDAAVTNLFYMNNIMHDVYYQYGFDEASGNFQTNVYGNGGTGGDAVNAQAQDGGGLNNANFGTPPDGGSPRMQMYLWSANGPAGTPLTVNNGTVAGDYTGIPAGFGAPLPTTPITQDIIVTDPLEACTPLTNSGEITGKIAILKRGECEFGVKVLEAENAGAVAVIVVNNVAGAPIVMGPGAVGDQVTIPAIMISMADGDAIIAAITGGETINGTLVEAGPFEIDGDLDNGIVAHEYGHGISNRLTGGRFNTGCLGNNEQMGEGWSDYFALMLTMRPGDLPGTRRGIATYSTGQPITGTGIRPAPYSTDRSINDFTYGDTNTQIVPHGVGFVWATMLWDLTWEFIRVYGFDPDIYNGTGGNNIALQLVMDGLKLQACNPGFINGRDAIIQADINANGGANECLIRIIFASRGLGSSASQGSSSSASDQVEAFDFPANCSLSVDDNTQDKFLIYPNPSNGQINIQSYNAPGDAVVTIFDLNGRQVYNQEMFLQNTVQISANGLKTGVYVIQIKGEGYTHTGKLIIE